MCIQIFQSSPKLNSLLKYKSYEHFKNSEVNILASFGTRNSDYKEMFIENRNKFNDAVLDSGAFTINNSKNMDSVNRLDFNGFKAFCKHLPEQLFKFIISYDEIFTPDGFQINYENTVELEASGIPVVPVIHDYTGKEFDETGFYLRKGYDLLAPGWATDKRKNVPTLVKRITQTGCKVHLLGGTSYDVLKNLAVNYCDSSNWTQAVVFGYIYYWNENDPKRNPLEDDMTDTIRFRDKENQPLKKGYYYGTYPWQKELDHYLKELFGFEQNDLYGHDRHLNRQVVNIHYFTVLQEKLRQYHKRNNVFATQKFAMMITNDLLNGKRLNHNLFSDPSPSEESK